MWRLLELLLKSFPAATETFKPYGGSLLIFDARDADNKAPPPAASFENFSRIVLL